MLLFPAFENQTEPVESYDVDQPEANAKREVREFVKMIAWFLLLFFTLKTFVIEGYEVQGPSMEPTLVDKERILVFKLPHKLSQWGPFSGIDAIGTGDIIVFDSRDDADKRYVKRVIAHGGPAPVRAQPDGYEPCSIGAEQALIDPGGMGRQSSQFPTGSGVPNPRRRILTGSRNTRTTRAERSVEHSARVPCQGRHFVARRRIPHPGCGVEPSRRDHQRAIRAELDVCRGNTVPPHDKQPLARVGVPHAS